METLKELRERCSAEFHNPNNILYPLDADGGLVDTPETLPLPNYIIKYYDDKTREIIVKKHINGVYTELSREKVPDDFDITKDGLHWDNLDQNKTLFDKAVKGIIKAED